LKYLQEAGFELLQRGVQYSSISERPKAAFKSGFAHMHNHALKDEESQNIPVMCKIRYKVNSVVLLDINEYIEETVHMPVIYIAW
jgi:hypothetical protein